MSDYYDRYFGGDNTCEWCGAKLGNYTMHANCPEEKEGRRRLALRAKEQQEQDTDAARRAQSKRSAAAGRREEFIAERRRMMDQAKSHTNGVEAVLHRSIVAPWTYVVRGRNGSYWGVCEHCSALEATAPNSNFPDAHANCKLPPGVPKWIWTKPGSQGAFVCYVCQELRGPNDRSDFSSDLCFRCPPF